MKPAFQQAEDIDLAQAPEGADYPPEEGKPGGLLSRMPSLIRRPDPMPEAELIEPFLPEQSTQAPGEDRVRAKIADVIKSRTQTAPMAPMVSEIDEDEALPPLTDRSARGAAATDCQCRRRVF